MEGCEGCVTGAKEAKGWRGCGGGEDATDVVGFLGRWRGRVGC